MGERRKKLDMIVLHDHTKGGVDIVDWISSKLSVRIKSKSWTVYSLGFILDTVRTNAITILCESVNSNLTTFKFTWELGKQLVTPNIEIRYNNLVEFQTKIYKKIAEVFGKEAVGSYEKTTLEDQGKDVGCVWKNLLATKTAKQRKTN